MGIAAEAFKKYVGEKSNGTMQVQPFYSGELGEETETLHLTRKGSLDLTCVGIANIIPFAKELGILNLPYIFDSQEEVVAATNGESAKILANYTLKAGFRPLTWTYTGFRYISNSRRPITIMSDIRRLDIRVPQNPILQATYKSWGANPIPLPWKETFDALGQGVLDGQCYGYIGFQAMKFHEARQKYITEIHYTYQLQPLLMSEAVFQKLTPAQQQIVIDAGKAAQDEVLQYQITQSAKAKEELIAAGVVVTTLENEDAWKKVAMEKVWPEMADFVGGKIAINSFLRSFGQPEWQ